MSSIPPTANQNTAQEKLRVLFVTEDDPLYVIQFFNVFFREYPRDILDIIGITVVDAFHEPIIKTAWRMLKFYGLFDFLRLGMRFIGVKLRQKSISSSAVASGIPLVPAHSINDAPYISTIEALEPDVIVSVAAPEIFKKQILGVPTKRCINIHSGRLPVYRGMMPNFWQLLHGEEHATITIHEMAEKLDAGGILATKEFPLQEKDSLNRVIIGTKQEGARLMIDVLSSISNNSQAEAIPIDMSKASYFSFPTPKDVRKLRKLGHKML